MDKNKSYGFPVVAKCVISFTEGITKFFGNSLKIIDYYWPLARGTWPVLYSYTGRASIMA